MHVSIKHEISARDHHLRVVDLYVIIVSNDFFEEEGGLEFLPEYDETTLNGDASQSESTSCDNPET